MLDKFAAASIRFLTLIIIFLGLSACHERLPPEIKPPPQSSWRNAFDRRRETISSYRAEARVSFSTSETKIPGRMTIVMKKPGNVRADFFDPFGRLKGLVIISGRRVFEYMPEISGDSKPGELSILAEMGQLKRGEPAGELASLITGLPGNFIRDADFRWGDKDERPKNGKEANSPAGTVISLAMHGAKPVVRKLVSRDLNAEEELVVTYDKYELIDDIPMPALVTISFPERKWMLRIQYRTLEINVDIDDELFRTDIRYGS